MFRLTALKRLLVCVVIGCLAGLIAAQFATWTTAVLIGWDAASVSFLVAVWRVIRRADSAQTASMATREDAGHVATDVFLVVGGVVSFGGAATALLHATAAAGSPAIPFIALGVFSIAASWLTVQTVFTLRYGRLYYTGKDGGIDFGETQPDYLDFAYVAFTVGMTFQVSDTNLTNRAIRRTALRQALLSYVFGTVIVAMTINVCAGIFQQH